MAAINITPMIDILLVLLVIFMVITPATPVGLEAQIPQPSNPEAAAENTAIIITMDADGGLRLNQESVDFEALQGRLQEVFQTRSDRTVFIQADSTLLYNNVAQLIDASRAAGVQQVGLLTEPLAAARR